MNMQHDSSVASAPPARISPALSTPLLAAIHRKGASPDKAGGDPFAKLGGGLAFHCTVNLDSRRVVETASMATAFRGYEALLPGKDLRKVGLVSSTASGICGGVHATASALCLEMALGLRPPPLGIVLRNLLLSCQYLNDNTMHLFVLAGPDYSQQVLETTNPELWSRAQRAPARHQARHGYARVGELMRALNKPDGKLYLKALDMIRTARKAYALLGGKYPHSESIVPGGVTLQPDLAKLEDYLRTLESFKAYTDETVAIWDEVFDFMLDADPRYADVGRSTPSLVDFGQWDNEEIYDATYANCDAWGRARWSTPGAVIDGRLLTTSLSTLNCGMEEFVDHSWYHSWVERAPAAIATDPVGNALSPHHPWNKRIIPKPPARDADACSQAYSWGTSLTWRQRAFEVGAYARMYISALAGMLPRSPYVHATGTSLQVHLPRAEGNDVDLEWKVPAVWNAFERNRARAYALGFNLGVTLEHHARACALLKNGDTQVNVPLRIPEAGRQLGVGLWGAGRGFLAHWAVLDDGRIDNYQIAIPSRINAAPRTPWGELGPCEQAVLNTPILETLANGEEGFAAIDVQRAIQSFDPCMTCTAHILLENSERVLEKVVDTSFPI